MYGNESIAFKVAWSFNLKITLWTRFNLIHYWQTFCFGGKYYKECIRYHRGQYTGHALVEVYHTEPGSYKKKSI